MRDIIRIARSGGASRHAAVRALLVVLGLAVGGNVAAVSLGTINVRSALNDPLDAEVALRGLTPGELEEMRVELAPQEAFAREGLKRSYLLSRLKFRTEAVGERGGRILVSSPDHIREPSLSFIVQVTSKGRIVQRRYDVLLNLRQ